ncbi:MAG: hypothetical protein ACMUIM_03760 [bacterium]
MFALDGCKIPSNASKQWGGTIEELKNKKREDREKGRATDGCTDSWG